MIDLYMAIIGTLCRLPKTAQDYVLYVEKALGVHIRYVSVGPGRDDYILR